MDIADLKVKIRADVSEVQQAVRDAANEGLRGANQQADRAERSLKGAAKAAITLQESLSAISEYLADAGLTAEEVADAMRAIGSSGDNAAKGAKNAAAAASQITDPTRAAAKAAQDLHQGFSLSATQIVRAGAGLLGVGLGINIIAGAARLAHQAIADLVSGQVALERSVRTTAALYGGQASSVQSLARAGAAAPDQAGTVQQHLQALNDSAFLQYRYGFTTGELGQLTSTGFRLSQAFGDNEQQQAARQAAFREFVESGGQSTALRDIGLGGTALDLARAIGGNSEAQVGVLTTAQQKQVAAQLAIINGNQAVVAGHGPDGDLLSKVAAARKARDEAASALHDFIGNPSQAPGSNGIAGQSELALQTDFPSILGPSGELQQRRDLGLGPGPGNTEARAQLEAAQAELDKWTKTLGDSQQAIDQAKQDLQKLGLELNTAGFRLAGFTGSIEDRLSIAHADINVQAQAAVAGRAIGPDPRYAKSALEIYTGSEQSGESAAYQQFVAEQAQQYRRQNGSAVIGELQRQVASGTPEQAAAAQRALDSIPRRQLGAYVGEQAGRAGDLAGRAQTEAQSELSSIQISQDERRVGVAEQLAGYRRDELEVEQRLSPLLLQQANLQDRIVVASRDNLETRKALIAAQQAALGPNNAVGDLDFSEQRLELRAEVSRASIRRGGAPTENMSQLRQQMRALELDRPATELAALDANRGVTLEQRQRTAEDLQRENRLADLDSVQRKLEDQLIPLQESARLAQAKNDAAQRALELLDLDDTKEIAAAQHRLNESNLLKLDADAAQRAANDYQAGLNLGADAAERSQTALEKARDALKDMVTLVSSQPDVNARIANGLGAGGLGGAVSSAQANGGITLVMIRSNDPAGIRQEISVAVDELLSGVATTGAPAPSTVGGAGR